MPRERKNKNDRWMPARVYRGKTKYEWHPKGGGAVSLCPLGATEAQVWQAYRDAVKKREGAQIVTVAELRRQYWASWWFLKLKPNTQRDYEDCWKSIEPVFGKMDCTKVQIKHIRQFMDKRGKVAPVRANRERTLLQNIYAYGIDQSIVKENPAVGLKPFPERGCVDVYVPDEEYYPFLEASEPICQVFMELAYLCAARAQDVRKIMLSDLKDEGIYIAQAKTGKKQIKAWNPELRKVVDLALQIRKERLKKCPVDSMYLIVTKHGTPYSKSGLTTLWARNRKAVEAKLKIKTNWTYHDLKAKGISDYEGDKRKFSGHKSHQQMERYNRKAEIVDALERRKKNENAS